MIGINVPCGEGLLRLHRLDAADHSFQLWACHTEDVPIEVLENPASLGWLSQSEIARWEKFRFSKDRDLYLTTRLLVRAVLSQYSAGQPEDWQFVSNSWGRPKILPEIADRTGLTGLCFNLSRSGSLAICGVSREGVIGVDVENLEAEFDVKEIAAGILAPEELAELNNVPASERKARLLRFWVLKEAYVKARGQGLSLDIKQISFSASRAPKDCRVETFLLFQKYLAAIVLLAGSIRTEP